MARTYNHIYNILVTEKNGLPGIVAYHLYKKHKVEKIKNFKDTNNGGEPRETFYKEFKDDSLKRVNEYLIAADKETNRLVDDYLKVRHSDLFLSMLTFSIQNNPAIIDLLIPEGLTPQSNTLNTVGKRQAQFADKQTEDDGTINATNDVDKGMKKKPCFIKKIGWYALAMLILTAITTIFTVFDKDGKEKEIVEKETTQQSNEQNKPEINITNNIITQNGNNAIKAR